MKNILMSSVSILLIGFSSYGFAASLDAHTLTNALRAADSTAPDKSFAIVYGGQDISRGSLSLREPKVNRPVLVA